MTNDEMHEIIVKAFDAAKKAALAAVASNPDCWYPCGFAWVRIKPARGKFVNYLKSINEGRTDEFAGGYVIYNPSTHTTQWMDAKYEGAKAFAEVLRAHGIKAQAECRMD